MKKSKKNNYFLTALITSIGIFILIFFFFWKILVPLDSDMRYWIKNILYQKNISKDIVLVKIDKLSTNKLWWPFDRKDYIKVVENLKKDWAKVIAFDIMFHDNWKDELKDRKLAWVFEKSWNIILWWKIEKNWSFSWPIFLDKKSSEKNINNESKKFYKNSIEKIWNYNPNINLITKKVTNITPEKKLKNWDRKKYIAFSIVELFWEKVNLDYLKNINLKKKFYINFSTKEKFKSDSFYNVYKNGFDKDKFKNKIVVIWYTVEWNKDQYYTPIWKVDWVQIILHTINTILTKVKTDFFNPLYEEIFIFLITLLIIYTNLRIRKSSQIKWLILWFLSVIILLFIIYWIYSYINLKLYNRYILTTFPWEFILAVFFSFFASTIFKYLKEDKNKKLLNKALWEYVSKDIADEILNGDWKINLEWEKKNISMFFSDIEGFTTISEKLGAKELVAFLQTYLWAMSEIIMENKGFIDKYEWDAIMALFWIFWKTNETKTFDILQSAIIQQQKLKKLNKNFKKLLWEELKVRMWIHTWDAIIWNIWAKWKKMEFTALWDNVNLASRLEWVNKFYWTYICCSENIYLVQKQNFEFRFLDNIKVKWKNNWVKIYELLWKKWEVSNVILEKRKFFEKALELYFNKNFESAIELFKKSEKLLDKPSTVFIFRCEYFIKNTPKVNWDWIWTMTEK